MEKSMKTTLVASLTGYERLAQELDQMPCQLLEGQTQVKATGYGNTVHEQGVLELAVS